MLLVMLRHSWIKGYKIRHRKGCSPNITAEDLQEIEDGIIDFVKHFQQEYGRFLPSGKSCGA